MELKPGYKQTEVGMIPEDWDPKNIGGFVTLRRGHDLTWRDRRDGDIPIMGSGGPNGFHDTALAKGPGVVLGRSGASFGQAHYCEPDFWPHNTALYVTDFKENHPLFVYYLLSWIDFSSHNSGGAQQSLNRNFIAPIEIGVPALDEQLCIAKALGDVDELIIVLEELISKKTNIKHAAMQELLTGKRRLPGFEGEWVVRRIADVGEPCSEKNTEGAILPVLTCSKHFGFMDSLGYFKNQVYSKDLSNYKVIRRDEIGYPANHIEEGSIGLQDLYDIALVSPIYVVFRVIGAVSSYFLHRLLKLDSYRHRFRTATSASVDRRGSLRWPVFSEISVKLPPTKAEQNAIAAFLSDLEAELTSLEARLGKTRSLKQGIMNELLTGRTRLI